jgi:hypothetical protein
VGTQKSRMLIETWRVNVTGGNVDPSGNWTTGHSCYTVAKNLSPSCLCPVGG